MSQSIIKGAAFVYGANISTDQIYPGQYLELTDYEDVAKHALEGADKEFTKTAKPGDIVVASTNFGCGSSREHAAVTLKAAGVGAIIADSFGRIFYRNAINLGLPLIVCKEFSTKVQRGDTLSINMTSGTIVNERTGETFQAEPVSEYTMNILASGGIKPLIKKEMTQ